MNEIVGKKEGGSNKKILFILKWYNKEKKKLNEDQRLFLLNKWIVSCTKFEEYEMSNALLVEKIKIIRNRRYRKIGKRTAWQTFKLRMKIIKRNGIRKTLRRIIQKRKKS